MACHSPGRLSVSLPLGRDPTGCEPFGPRSHKRRYGFPLPLSSFQGASPREDSHRHPAFRPASRAALSAAPLVRGGGLYSRPSGASSLFFRKVEVGRFFAPCWARERFCGERARPGKTWATACRGRFHPSWRRESGAYCRSLDRASPKKHAPRHAFCRRRRDGFGFFDCFS